MELEALVESEVLLPVVPLSTDLIDAIDGCEKGARMDFKSKVGGPCCNALLIVIGWLLALEPDCCCCPFDSAIPKEFEAAVPAGSTSNSMSLVCDRKRTNVNAGSILRMENVPNC